MISRRWLLRAALLVVAASLLLLAWRFQGLRRTARGYLEPRLDRSSAPGALSPGELDTVLALGEAVVSGHPLAAPARRYLADHINERTREGPGFLSLYRSTAGVLDGLAGGTFAALAVPERVSLVGRHLFPGPEGPLARDLRLVFRRRLVAVRELAIPDLIRGYYASAGGWELIGYSTFPGRCGDLLRYTHPE